ncbi:MAG: 54S ribosomal protein L9, mitochondrial [Chaenotheca gracillima]|nr:MAG: 54S ribosomal protein L9, mitochondrial [Chaenotheca gracillima]
MATARLRSTFKYPSDSVEEEDDDTPTHMDEQEQETFIQDLRTRNASQNTLYTNMFLALPLILTLPYLRLIVLSSTAPGNVSLPSLLSLTSLLSTAYIFRYIRFEKLKRQANNLSLPEWAADEGPLNLYLPWLNALICTILGFVALWQWHGSTSTVERSTGGGERVLWLIPSGKTIPMPTILDDIRKGLAIDTLIFVVIYAIIMFARYTMQSVDVSELERLRYSYKGA